MNEKYVVNMIQVSEQHTKKPYQKPEMDFQVMECSDILNTSGFEVKSYDKLETQLDHSFWSKPSEQ